MPFTLRLSWDVVIQFRYAESTSSMNFPVELSSIGSVTEPSCTPMLLSKAAFGHDRPGYGMSEMGMDEVAFPLCANQPGCRPAGDEGENALEDASENAYACLPSVGFCINAPSCSSLGRPNHEICNGWHSRCQRSCASIACFHSGARSLVRLADRPTRRTRPADLSAH